MSFFIFPLEKNGKRGYIKAGSGISSPDCPVSGTGTMNAIKLEKNFHEAPVHFVPGSSVVSVAVALLPAIIFIILSAIIIIAPPGTA